VRGRVVGGGLEVEGGSQEQKGLHCGVGGLNGSPGSLAWRRLKHWLQGGGAHACSLPETIQLAT
jgi:hypothetical protein